MKSRLLSRIQRCGCFRIVDILKIEILLQENLCDFFESNKFSNAFWNRNRVQFYLNKTKKSISWPTELILRNCKKGTLLVCMQPKGYRKNANKRRIFSTMPLGHCPNHKSRISKGKERRVRENLDNNTKGASFFSLPKYL